MTNTEHPNKDALGEAEVEAMLAVAEAEDSDTPVIRKKNQPEVVAEEVPAHIDAVQARRILEAAVFAADSPLDRDALLLLFDEADRPERSVLNLLLKQLADDYTERGIELREVASGFRFQVRTEMGPWVSRLWQEKSPRYSRAILETLALIAYRQPITRGEIEEIRGVAVNTQIIKTLLERNWVRVVGHRDVPGRPAMFATTRQFLDYFNLKSLDEMPSLAEIRDLDKINEELQLEEARAAGLLMPQQEVAEGEASDTERQIDIMDQINREPEIDESTLMSLEQVDTVLEEFEAQFRKKPADQPEAAVDSTASVEQSDLGQGQASADDENETEHLPAVSEPDVADPRIGADNPADDIDHE